MERSQRIGLIVSGGAHLGAILWLLLGGIFFSHELPPPVATAEVTLMSEAEFSALQAAAPKAATEAPPQPSVPEPPAAEEVPPAPEAETPPEAATPDAPAPEPEPDPAPDLTEITPPAMVVEDTPPTPPAPPVEEPSAEPEPVVAPKPQPKPADIVAPDPVEAPEPLPDTAPEAVAETTPDPAAEDRPVEPEAAAAPQETGDVLKTEENEDQEKVASAAPATSPRPASRPAKPAPAEPEAAPATEPAQAAAEPEAPAEDAVADALAEALAGEASEEPAPGTGTAPSGPPLTGGEKDALVLAVKACWNVGALSTEALGTIVTVSVSMDQGGMPIQNSIRMIGYEGGDEAAARQAYEAGRRAIIRCARNGYPLPPEKYAQWQEVEIVFNPEKMRMK